LNVRLLKAVGALLAALLIAPLAHAHKPSDSYLSLTVADAGIEGRWDIALRDVDFAIGLDANGDGDITWGEVRTRHADIAAYALARLAIRGDGASCSVTVGQQAIDGHTDGAYTVLPLRVSCPNAPTKLALTYTLFADLDPMHRGLLNLQAHGSTRAAVLGPQAPTQEFDLKTTSRLAQFLEYGREGVWHIWIGFDHILFLLSLLLPAVLAWHDRRWSAATSFREAFWDVFKIVTAFTVAHSITLSLATLGVVSLPSRWVESAIAGSVVLAALNNIFPVVHGRRWVVAFCFGLIHGFGFASVLADLGLPREALVLALVGFNVGVEVGQLAIVLAFLPLAFALRRTWLYRRLVFVGGSMAVVAIAGMWLVERSFDLKVMPF
jgi:hypothetical protein